MHLLYPWFLLGLTSVIIPIIIHLLQLRRPQKLLFTNIILIQEVKLVTVRQRELQHLLILASRIMGLAVLAIAFCQPYIVEKKTSLTTQSTNVVDVLIDNSASMQVPKKEGSVFSVALKKGEILGMVYSDDQFRLLNSSNTLIRRSVYQSELAELHPTSSNLTISKAIRGGFNAEATSPLYVFSDFQRTNFGADIFKHINSSREIVLVPQTGEQTGNVFVDSVWFDEAFLRVRTNAGLHIRLQNGGNEAIVNCPVKIFLGSQQVASFQTNLAVTQSSVAVVQVQLPDQQLTRGRVVTGDLPVIFDNTYYFTAQAANVIRVVEVGSTPIAKFLYNNEPLFSYSFAKPESISYDALRRANLVLVREIPVVTSGLRDALRAVVARGGSVAIVPSSMLSSQGSYQQLFQNLGLGAADWVATGKTPELHEVALPNANDPFFRDIMGAQPRTVAMPRVAPVLRWARTGTDVLRLRDGENYLAEFTSGTGKVYVFAAPFAKEYSDFTEHTLFVPVLYKLAMRSFRSEQQTAYRLTQNLIRLSLPAMAGGPARADQNPLRLVRDSAVWLPVQRLQGDEVRLELPASLQTPGFYQVQRTGQTLTTVALNASAKESELASYSAAELRALVGPNRPNVRVLDGVESSKAMLTQLQDERNGQPLWRYFLGVALLCLLAEALLLRFGRPRAGVVRVAAAA